MEQITLRVPASLKESLKEAAESHDESLSAYIRQQLESEGEHGGDSERVEALQNRIDSLRSDLAEKQERIDDLRDDREERIRLEARVEQLEADLERVREERDSAQARYNEAQGKLKVHHSEQDGAVARVKAWLS